MTTMEGQVFYSLSALLGLCAFWLLLSGIYTPFLIVAGAASALAVLLFAHRMDRFDRQGRPAHVSWRALFWYWTWLGKEIIVAAWDVSRRIVDPRLPITPTLARFKPLQSTELGLVIHANSITLTPGTITVEVSTGEILVHALSAAGAAGLAGSAMDRRVAALEESTFEEPA
ncbi:MAG: Na+/H+ antiporter subunit E [Candidatus Accumulibacter meliphilus]|jgi:multicomponent Na+:H+ antiporter subunit E|uniref:Na+/H+ antiporter subunit E n=1 Tax=Candidatus Accumulibacter meliphilus TaxID=2211374 RepID=UPI002FC3669A